MATILGVISMASLIAAVYLTYLNGGGAPQSYGFTGLLAVVFSLAGLLLGIVTVQDKSYYMLFPWLGILLNLASLGGVALILYLS